MRRLATLGCMVFTGCAGFTVLAYAKTPVPGMPDMPSLESDAPVMLTADQLDYDSTGDVVLASGHVEVAQGDTLLMADSIRYDRKSNVVSAEGSVSVLEPSGNVYFADRVELKDDMKTGVIQEFKARLADESVFAARTATRVSETVTELEEAVYSPCRLVCDDGTAKTPFWQVKAEKVRIDTEEEQVTYKNAFMELYGVPVLYTPYLAHPTPDAANQSGILVPEFRRDSNLGSIFTVPVYYSIAKDRDVTITPIYTTKEGLVMAGEYRQMFDNGAMKFEGSLTNPSDRDALGNPTNGNTWRGHLRAEGDFILNEEWTSGFNIKRTSDDTYLRRYDFGNESLLISRAYAQGLDVIKSGRRNYILSEGLAFQGLTQLDDSERSPYVLPVADFFYETDPLAYGSRIQLTGNLMSLTREEGPESRRVSTSALWKLPYITSGGHAFTLASELRVDGYDVDDVTRTGGPAFDGTTGRVIPQISAEWRYPLLKRLGEGKSLLIEPIANIAVSPHGSNDEIIPNEDSALPEFNDNNLFSLNRFGGYDRVEEGVRANYGLRSQLSFDYDKQLSLMLGQNYRGSDSNPLIPLSNDLQSHASDYVGRVGLTYHPVDVEYRFRLDKDQLTPKRSEVNAFVDLSPVTLFGSYLKLDNDPVLLLREEIAGGFGFDVTREWTLTGQVRRDLVTDDIRQAGLGVIFHNECVTITTSANRDYTRDRDVQESTSFMVRVGLKNLE